MKYILIFFGVFSIQLFGQCPPELIHKELQSPHGYLSLRVKGLNQYNLSEVTAFVDSVATQTGRDPSEIIHFLRGIDSSGEEIAKVALENRIRNYFKELNPQRVFRLRSHPQFKVLYQMFGEHIDHLSADFYCK